MTTPARFCSVQLARFASLRTAEALRDAGLTDLRHLGLGADLRAAGSDVTTREAFVFLLFGLHDTLAGAEACLAARPTLAPWWDEALETWGAALEPVRTFGESNHLDPAVPGPLFQAVAPSSDLPGPFVSVTSVGWGPTPDMAAVQDFGAGVMAVRMSMGGTPGLHAQHSFFFPGVIAIDPVTVSIWHSGEALRTFAYDGGAHRRQMDRFRERRTADRTSSMRGRIRAHRGTWLGSSADSWGSRV